MFKKFPQRNKKLVFTNEYIKAKEVRLIDKDGKQLGIFNLSDAIKKAQEARLDLIQVTEKVEPPVCRIMEYGKYVYQLQKKERGLKQKAGELKNIRMRFNISEHDLGIKADLADKFLKKNYKVRIELVLKGREWGLSNFAKEKLEIVLSASAFWQARAEGEFGL